MRHKVSGDKAAGHSRATTWNDPLATSVDSEMIAFGCTDLSELLFYYRRQLYTETATPAIDKKTILTIPTQSQFRDAHNLSHSIRSYHLYVPRHRICEEQREKIETPGKD